MVTAAFCVAYLGFTLIFTLYSVYYVLVHVVLGLGGERAPTPRPAPDVVEVRSPSVHVRRGAELREPTGAWSV
jgi:hypothetical protein